MFWTFDSGELIGIGAIVQGFLLGLSATSQVRLERSFQTLAANFEVSFGFLNRGTPGGVLHMLLGSSLGSSALPLHTTFLSAQLFSCQPLEFAWAALSTWVPFICLPRPKQTSCLLLLTSKRMSHRSLSVSVAQHGCLNDRPFCRAHEARATESR